MADATRGIKSDEQKEIEVNITTPPKITENTTKYLSKSLPDLTNVVAVDANNGNMLDVESSGIDENHTDVHAYLEEQRHRLEAILGADRNVSIWSFQCCIPLLHQYHSSVLQYRESTPQTVYI